MILNNSVTSYLKIKTRGAHYALVSPCPRELHPQTRGEYLKTQIQTILCYFFICTHTPVIKLNLKPWNRRRLMMTSNTVEL